MAGVQRVARPKEQHQFRGRTGTYKVCAHSVTAHVGVVRQPCISSQVPHIYTTVISMNQAVRNETCTSQHMWKQGNRMAFFNLAQANINEPYIK
jgi:hypothetical protein